MQRSESCVARPWLRPFETVHPSRGTSRPRWSARLSPANPIARPPSAAAYPGVISFIGLECFGLAEGVPLTARFAAVARVSLALEAPSPSRHVLQAAGVRPSDSGAERASLISYMAPLATSHVRRLKRRRNGGPRPIAKYPDARNGRLRLDHACTLDEVDRSIAAAVLSRKHLQLVGHDLRMTGHRADSQTICRCHLMHNVLCIQDLQDASAKRAWCVVDPCRMVGPHRRLRLSG